MADRDPSKDYHAFLASKRIAAQPSGFEAKELNRHLKPFQADITRWACRQGRAGVWADTGLGKTIMQEAWAEQVHRETGRNVLILCPLAVAKQSKREAEKFGIGCPVNVCRKQADVQPGISVTNYQMLKHFDPDQFAGVVIDESDILADFSGSTKKQILAAFRQTPYKLDCSATPAPNDHMEIGNHADFLNVMGSNEMLARWFINDAGEAGAYRLKEHGKADFWRWVSSWACAITKPSDLGYEDAAYDLPPLIFHDEVVEVDTIEGRENGFLFRMPSLSATGMHREKRRTIKDRAKQVERIVASVPKTEPILIWCHTDYEADTLKDLPGVIEVRGSQKLEEKESKLEAFQLGQIRILLSKPSICGHGLNLQHCRNVIYVGLDYCFDETTEILTPWDWKTFGELSVDSPVGTINPRTGNFEWQLPNEVIWNPYEGEMVHFKGRAHDQLVTPNHRMWVKRCGIRHRIDVDRWHIRTADDLASNYKRQEFRFQTTTTTWEGMSPEFVNIPKDGRVDYSRAGTRSIGRMPIDSFAALAGWFLSEGCVRTNRGNVDGVIVICQTDIHPENRLRIIQALEATELPVHSETKDIRICNRELAFFLSEQFGHRAGDKHIPAWVKQWKTSHLKILWDAIMDGDGMHAAKRDDALIGLATTSPKLADDCQEIGFKLGFSCSAIHNGSNALNIRPKHSEPAIVHEPERVHYKGMIGCVSVPNGLVVVRRNGHAVVSGNSFKGFYQSIRRCWRFGQTQPVHVYVIQAETEGRFQETLQRKQRDYDLMKRSMVEAMMKHGLGAERTHQNLINYNPTLKLELPRWLTSAS